MIYQLGDSLLGLRTVGSDVFDEGWVGLDRVSFMVSSTVDLEAAATLLDDCGIARGGIKNIGPASILDFRDPDNIGPELLARNA